MTVKPVLNLAKYPVPAAMIANMLKKEATFLKQLLLHIAKSAQMPERVMSEHPESEFTMQ